MTPINNRPVVPMSGNPGNIAQSTQPQPMPSMAPIGIAMPGAPRGASRSGAPDRGSVSATREAARAPFSGSSAPSRADIGKAKLEQASEKLKQAQQAGVDVAKSSWFKKAIGAAISVATVAVAAALTVMSFGGAAPLLAVACATCAVSCGDAYCAWRNYKDAQAEANGQVPANKLPLGNSCIANGTHYILTRLGVEDATARTVGKVTGGVVGVGLIAASIATGQGLSTLPMALDVARMATSALNGANVAVSGIAYFATRDLDQELAKSDEGVVRALLAQAEPHLDDTGRAQVAQLRSELDGDSAPSARLRTHQQAGRGFPERLIEDGPGAVYAAVTEGPGVVGRGLLSAGVAVVDAIADYGRLMVQSDAMLAIAMPGMPMGFDRA